MIDYVMIFSITIYICASVFLMFYGLHCYAMVFLFYSRQKKCRREIQTKIDFFLKDNSPNNFPYVTIQLPIYNEAEVVQRLVKSAAKLDYPKDKFEIQILDDSIDETSDIVNKLVKSIARDGINICVLRRENREHFKAGALTNALLYARGEYVAIFDSDFIIPTNFLKRSIAQLYSEPKIACLQGRWGHINRLENWLTKAQSIGIDGHFAAEQGARSYNGLCMNFNGTAGVWRVSAIKAAGGWSGDTLTEDLDLSYRVQLVGYKISYDFDLICPAELPNNVIALKSQQKRWAKGSMETAIKLLPAILKSDKLNLAQKTEAVIHLTHYGVSLLMLILAVFTLPVLYLAPLINLGIFLPIIWTVIVLSMLAPCTLYTGSGAVQKRGLFSLLHFPAMIVVGTGLCLNNAFAVLEALCGKKSEFVRTPKSGSSDILKKKGMYKLNTKIFPALFEILLGFYCAYTFTIYFYAKQYFFGFFIGAYAFGLIFFGIISILDLLDLNKVKIKFLELKTQNS